MPKVIMQVIIIVTQTGYLFSINQSLTSQKHALFAIKIKRRLIVATNNGFRVTPNSDFNDLHSRRLSHEYKTVIHVHHVTYNAM